MLMPKMTYLPGRHHQQGLAVVEFTIMLPLLLLMFYATIELGRAFYTYNTMTKRVESGARYLSQHALRGSIQNVELDQDELTNMKNIIVYGSTSGAGSEAVDGFTVNDISVSAVNTVYFQVDVSYVYRPLFGNRLSLFGLGNDIDMSIPLNASVTMRGIN